MPEYAWVPQVAIRIMSNSVENRHEVPRLSFPRNAPEDESSLHIDMKRNRIQFEANGEASSASPPQNGFTPEERPHHVPKISRRIRACTECKRHKVRCDMKATDSVCSRCRRMGLECVVNKSLQTLLEDEAE